MQTAQQGGARHAEQTKLRVLAHFASSGSPVETSRATGIPESTIREWTKDEKGQELIASVRESLRIAIAADLVDNARLAVAEVRDRLVNGDEVITAGGEKVRRRVSGKDACYIASNSISQHAQLTMDHRQIAGANLKALAADLVAALQSADAVSQAKLIEHDQQLPGEQPKAKRKSRKAGAGEGG